MKTLRLPVSCAVGAVCLLVCFAQVARAQVIYEPQVLIPVTFFDFRSDRSNPEFEQPHGPYQGGTRNVRPGMVANTLDLDGKPKARNMTPNLIMDGNSNNAPYLNYGIRFWFRDWNNLTASSSHSARMAGQPHENGTLVPAGTNATYLTRFKPIYEYGSNGGAWGSAPPALRGNPNNPGGEWNAERIRLTSLDYANSGSNAFQNRVVPATLIFTHIGNGMYRFSSDRGDGFPDGGFYPLRNGGLNSNYPQHVRFNIPAGQANAGGFTDNTWTSTNGNTSNNLAFTMEMVCNFKMEPGLVFTFKGDDDVWVFINNQLAIDIGGIHEDIERSVNLDNLRASHGLVNGQAYDLRMFYCERHADGSNIKITTNVVTAIPNRFSINVDGGPMTAGIPKLATAVVGVDTGAGVLKDYSKGHFTWTARDLGGFNTATQLTVVSARTGVPLTKTDSINVTAQKAYTTIRIYGEYYDTTTMTRVRDSADVWVGPGAPARVWIEATQDSMASLRNSNRMPEIRISSTQEFNDNFFGILRDQYGNWVSTAFTGTGVQGRAITWRTEFAAIATAQSATAQAGYTPTFGTNRGQGRANRVATEGRTPVYVNYSITSGAHAGVTIRPDTSLIIIESITYTAVRIGVMQNGTFIMISEAGAGVNVPTYGTIDMVAGADTTLWVQLRRSDNGQWDQMPATWTSTNVPGVTPPTGNTVSWTLRPNGESTNGRVTATIPNTATNAYVNIRVANMDPTVMRFFNRRGAPGNAAEITSFVWPGALPAAVSPYPVPNGNVTVSAGNTLPITAKMFTALPVSAATWLQNFESPVGSEANRWTWSFVPGTPANAATTLSGTNGDSIAFRSTVAHQTYQVRAVFTMGALTIQQDIHIRVIPSMENPKLVIEPDRDGLTLSPNTSRKVDNIVFAVTDQSKTVYAVIRDQYDNFICLSGGPNVFDPAYDPNAPVPPTNWTPTAAQSEIIIARNGYAPDGEGIAEKSPTAVNGQSAWMKASDQIMGRNLRDSVRVQLLGYDYNELRIVTRCTTNPGGANGFPAGYCPIADSLRLTTNDTETIYVFGKRTDCGDAGGPTGAACWEQIVVDWGRDLGLGSALSTTPSGTNNWTLVPQATGTGQITATRRGATGSGATTSIPVVIKVGPPLRAELHIITPPDQIRAGEPIRAVVMYYNKVGLITEWDPAWTSAGAGFRDTVGIRSNSWIPLVNSKGARDSLNYPGMDGFAGRNKQYNASLRPGLTTGSDTVTFIIYNATDNPHQIRYNETIRAGGVDYPVTAVSDRFTLRAGDPFVITITADGKTIDSTRTLTLRYQDTDVILRTVAYDEYGNRVGDHPSCWNSDGQPGVPVIADVCGRPLVIYTPNTATENGSVLVCAHDENKPDMRDCITIVVTGVTTLARTATTRDYDGCGYLSAIELKFPKVVDLVAGSKPTPASLITISFDGKTIVWDSVSVRKSDSTAFIWLREDHSMALQTGWTPRLIINDGVFTDVGYQTHTCLDGAAPVISTARLFFSRNNVAKENYIDVTFSENIRSSNGRTFRDDAANFIPNMLFNIWELRTGQAKRAPLFKSAKSKALLKAAHEPNAGQQFNPLPDQLVGITQIHYVSDNTLRFYLENEKEIGPPRHYINIKTVPNPSVQDVPALCPVKENNRKVPVIFGNEPNGNMVAIPNPAVPDGKRVEPGRIDAYHDVGAIEYIKGGGSGTVFEVPIYVPKTGKVRCQLKVYDLAGNLVNSGENNDAAKGVTGVEDGGYAKLHLYWNGYNSKKMRVAPGSYRIVVYVSYTGVAAQEQERAKNRKFQGTVGVAK